MYAINDDTTKNEREVSATPQNPIKKQLELHPTFNDVINDVKRMNIALPAVPSQPEIDLQNFIFPLNGELVTKIEDVDLIELDATRGRSFICGDRSILAYDESINKFSCLEGTAYLTSHSIVTLEQKDYTPRNLLTFNFYTRSKEIASKSLNIKYTDDPDMTSKKDYIEDKIDFLLSTAPKKSILFIDGPLIGGDVYTYMIRAINKFLENNIIPIFFVKNSSSNLVVDNTPELRSIYNSDMHWAYKFLRNGYRTTFFKYVDRHEKKNAKIFCYLKPFDVSPQRVEFHIATYEQYNDIINDIIELAYYLILVQGDLKNPQVRPIAIAEKFARETIHLIDINKIMRTSGAIPTMNQERFGR